MQNNKDALEHRLPAYVIQTPEEKQADMAAMGEAIEAQIADRIQSDQAAIAEWTDDQKELAISLPETEQPAAEG